MIDKEKLLKDMQQRYDSLNSLIYRDHPNAEKLYERWMELKYWKESIERNTYDMKG